MSRTEPQNPFRKSDTKLHLVKKSIPVETGQPVLPGCDVSSGMDEPANASIPDPTDRPLMNLSRQIEDCLAKERHPGLRLFLEQLHRNSYRYPPEFVRQEFEVYQHADTPDDFLTRLARLHWTWAMDDIAVDTDGKWLKSGDCGTRATVVGQLRETLKGESDPFMRCYLVKLVRRAVTDPVGAGESLKGYIHGRHNAIWIWLATVFVTGTPEAAFQWALAEARRKLTDPELSGPLDTLEQVAKVNLPLAVSGLESLMEKGALPDGLAEVNVT